MPDKDADELLATQIILALRQWNPELLARLVEPEIAFAVQIAEENFIECLSEMVHEGSQED